MPVRPPVLPFPDYKWRWAVYTPTEGLNEPPVYLGVLRAMRRCEGHQKSSREFFEELQRIEEDVRGRVTMTARLARPTGRNLLRNSEQYWRALGLMQQTVGEIALTDYGRRIADGGISRGEFASTSVKTLTLPNQRIQDDATVREWLDAGLQIRPLHLILEIVIGLEREGAAPSLTTDELTKIVIPLAGEGRPTDDYLEAIVDFRAGRLDLATWPDCTPDANDKRMAREFLLFLSHYGYLELSGHHDFSLNNEARSEVAELLLVEVDDSEPEEALEDLREEGKDLFIERSIVVGMRIARPGQRAFRKDVLREYRSECLLTGERIPQVLEAAHIIPVANDGTDSLENGICLRTDVHTLFDAGHIRVFPDGSVTLSELAGGSPIYGTLPSNVTIPSFVSRDALTWRWNYN